jgi:hypothetical protein
MKLLKHILGIVSPSQLREAKYKSVLTAFMEGFTSD